MDAKDQMLADAERAHAELSLIEDRINAEIKALPSTPDGIKVLNSLNNIKNYTHDRLTRVKADLKRAEVPED